jgi:hypothetical protein
MININELSEQLQENIMIYLDGFSDEILSGVCQVIVDTVKDYK